MTASITGGSVTFEQSRKLAEYENRKAVVTFNVNGADGDDASGEVKRALDLAQSHVFEALGLKKPEIVQAAPAAAAPIAANDNTKEKKVRTGNAGKTKEAKPVENVTQSLTKDQIVDEDFGKAQISTGEERKEPEAEVDEDFTGNNQPLPEITDKELQNACSKKNTELVSALGANSKIRTLIAKYVAPPAGAASIPQEARRKFLDELEALKP